MQLSIIIPIYNSERFLKDCIDSVYVQDLSEKDFELILIDDGSTDNSLQICKTCQKEHSNILIIRKENGGQATARNLGIRKAFGKYIMFVDSDDRLLPYTIHHLLEKAEKTRSEITISSMIVYNSTGQTKQHNDFPHYNKTVNGEEAILSGLNFGSSCARLYKRDFLLHNRIEFMSGIKHEDVLFSIKCTIPVYRLTSIDICTYEYRWVEGSTDRNTDFSQRVKSIFSDLIIANEEKKISLNKNISNELRIFLNHHYNSLITSNIIHLLMNYREYHSILSTYIKVAKKTQMLPIKGGTLSWKSGLLCRLINLLLTTKILS